MNSVLSKVLGVFVVISKLALILFLSDYMIRSYGKDTEWYRQPIYIWIGLFTPLIIGYEWLINLLLSNKIPDNFYVRHAFQDDVTKEWTIWIQDRDVLKTGDVTKGTDFKVWGNTDFKESMQELGHRVNEYKKSKKNEGSSRKN